MQASPLQLVEFRFVKVHVEPTDMTDVNAPLPRSNSSAFDFSGVQIQAEIGHGFRPPIETAYEENGEQVQIQPYVVSLGIAIAGDDGRPTPYKIDVKCVGYFNVLTAAFPDEARRQDVVVVNGASMLYGAIRDMVATVTARGWKGEMLLPAMSFADDAPNKQKK
jgi:preprotein translocase subunit SecB